MERALSASRPLASRPRRAVTRGVAPRPAVAVAAARSPAAATTTAAALTAVTPLLTAAAAFAADEPTAAAPSSNPFEIVLALSPAIFYGLLTLVRKVNPNVKISDLLFALAGTVIFANIVSILVFKKRIY